MSAEFKVGDRVKVALEGKVTRVLRFGEGCFELRVENENTHPQCVYTDSATVEKVEPPVEAFKPGDLVRDLNYPREVRALSTGGYVNLTLGAYYEWGDPGASYPNISDFTSENFERVEV